MLLPLRLGCGNQTSGYAEGGCEPALTRTTADDASLAFSPDAGLAAVAWRGTWTLP